MKMPTRSSSRNPPAPCGPIRPATRRGGDLIGKAAFAQIEFETDSPLEGTGFELSVLHETGSNFETSSEFGGQSTVGAAVSSEQSSASAKPIERFRGLEEPTHRRIKAPALSAGHRGTESSNPFPSCGESTNFRFRLR